MLKDGPGADSAAAKTLHTLEFKGTGGEYFRIWIVNLALTVITLGVYGAWAKVRTIRYFRGNTFLAGHPFDYHASPVRILIGRAIAVTFLLAYIVTTNFYPLSAIAWSIFFLFLLPWLIVSSLRFNARNTSYRNVRFNFVGSLASAARAYILWPFLCAFTLFTTWPLVHRTRDYFLINNHTFGGKEFHTEFSGWRIYRIYLLAFLAFVAALIVIGTIGGLIAFGLMKGAGIKAMWVPGSRPGGVAIALTVVAYLIFFFVMFTIQVMVHAMSMNLALNNATLDGRHELRSNLGAWSLAWIVFTNTLLTLLTLGIYYPWASVRLSRYEISRFAVLAATDLDEFTSEAIATQSAIGEEIASFFDLGISL